MKAWRKLDEIWMLVSYKDLMAVTAKTNGLNAVFIFSSQEKAEEFRRNAKMEASHGVGKETASEFKSLAHRYARFGITHVALDPEVDCTQYDLLPLLAWLVALDSSEVPVNRN